MRDELRRKIAAAEATAGAHGVDGHVGESRSGEGVSPAAEGAAAEVGAAQAGVAEAADGEYSPDEPVLRSEHAGEAEANDVRDATDDGPSEKRQRTE